MLPSFQDDRIVGYEVDCEGGQIKLHIKPAASATEQAASTVLFTGVGFVLSSRYGLSGWVLAREAFVVARSDNRQ